MCLISNHIKFCTCSSDYETLQHYWVLYSFDKNKKMICIGETMMPTQMLDKNFAVNRDNILARLKEPDAFDTIIEFKEKDTLQIVINNKTTSTDIPFIYTFRYKRQQWIFIEEDCFDLLGNYNEYTSGKIESAFETK